jgi:hypothetical protein
MKITRILATAFLVVGCGQSLPVASTPPPSLATSPSTSIVPSQVPIARTPTPTQSPPAYTVDCGPMEPAECQAQAAAIATEYRSRIVAIQFTSVHGDMRATLEDGSSIIRIVDGNWVDMPAGASTAPAG